MMLTSPHGPDVELPEIPVLDVGRAWPVETLEIALDRAHALLDEAATHLPDTALKLGDAVSRRWLARWHNPHLDEIDRIAALIGRPGTYYFNINYEWGCSSSVGRCPDGRSARIMRVLDWPTNGIGRHVIAARIDGDAGPWVTLTWPGYTGVLQAVAPGRFAAALNQAPLAEPTRLFAVDWAIARTKVWRSAHVTPAHLLRRAFETAASYTEARRMLSETPVSAPTIFALSGVGAGESCIIERTEQEAHVLDGPAAAANDWQNPAWSGHVRGEANAERRQAIAANDHDLDEGFAWLQPPVLNELTRLALAADAAAGHLVAQGFEADGPATQVLSLTA